MCNVTIIRPFNVHAFVTHFKATAYSYVFMCHDKHTFRDCKFSVLKFSLITSKSCFDGFIFREREEMSGDPEGGHKDRHGRRGSIERYVPKHRQENRSSPQSPYETEGFGMLIDS